MADDTDRILNQYGPQDDEHGFLFSRVGGDLKFNPYEAIKKFMAYRGPPGALSTSGDDTPIRNAADVAGWVGLSGLGLNAFGAVPANALGSAGAKAPQALRAAAPPRVENPIRAYHGSPHDFDRFDLSKIGTGEGAQAYGHGLYFAEAEPVAREYRNRLSQDVVTQDNIHDPHRVASRIFSSVGGDKKLAITEGKSELDELINSAAFKAPATPEIGAYVEARANALREALTIISSNQAKQAGRMYEVAIHATPDQFLDWDKPLSQQSEAVRKAFEGVQQAPDIPGQLAYYRMAGDLTGKKSISSPEVATKLSEQGIPGIRYLDQGSRGAGQGTHNYVVFDPERIEILRKYGLLGPVAGLSTADILQRYGQDERE